MGGCSSCGKKIQQNVGKPNHNSSNGYRRTMGSSSPSTSFGKPKIRFSGRGR